MHRSLRQFPDQPGLNRSEKEFPTFRLFSCTLYIVQNPFYFGARKIDKIISSNIENIIIEKLINNEHDIKINNLEKIKTA